MGSETRFDLCSQSGCSITPTYVDTAMRHISAVELRNIEVDLLD